MVKKQIKPYALKPKTAPLLPSGDYSVFVDILFENSLLYFVIVNTNDFPVFNVHVDFSKPIEGMVMNVNNSQRIKLDELDVFKKLRFLAPNKQIKILIDSSTSYFRRKQPSLVQLAISYRYPNGKRFCNGITHDMRIYKDLVYTI